jgi:hypothetical protein
LQIAKIVLGTFGSKIAKIQGSKCDNSHLGQLGQPNTNNHFSGFSIEIFQINQLHTNLHNEIEIFDPFLDTDKIRSSRTKCM